MKKIYKIVLGVVLVFFLIAGGGIFYLSRGLEDGKSIKVNAVEPSALKDGVYTGEYKDGRWSNSLKVTVKSGKITAIDILKDVTFPKPEWTKALFEKVIEKQNIDVDVISGATVTSKAYLKSIEDALD